MKTYALKSHSTVNIDTVRVLRIARLAFSGALVGTALVGTVFPHEDLIISLVGAVAGFVAVLLVKATHVI